MLCGPPRHGKSLFAASLVQGVVEGHSYAPSTVPRITRFLAHLDRGNEIERDEMVNLVELSDTCHEALKAPFWDDAHGVLLFVDAECPEWLDLIALHLKRIRRGAATAPICVVLTVDEPMLTAPWPPRLSVLAVQNGVRDVVAWHRASTTVDQLVIPVESLLGHCARIKSMVHFSKFQPSFAKEMDPEPLRIALLSSDARAPERATPGSAGYDLFASRALTVPARGHALAHTDISVAIPQGLYGRIAPRSGLALKHGIHVMAGVIDRDYRGSVGVVLYNHKDVDFQIAKHDRIAQLLLERVETPEIVISESLDATGRGEGGFGSTGR